MPGRCEARGVTNGTSGGERIKGRYDVTIGRGSIVASYGM
jgi:hypothetical protein